MTRSTRHLFILAFAFLFAAVGIVPAFGQDDQSLGDIARELRDKKRPEVQINKNDAKELFAETDTILQFASEDTGYARHIAVKRQLISRDQLGKRFADAAEKSGDEESLRSELVMKKLGLLPPQFDLKQYSVDKVASQVAGFYSHTEKTMYLVDWVPVEEQRPVMAHELTHALQDQNFNLTSFMRAAAVPGRTKRAELDAEASTARRAIVEGQAMVVFVDYLLKQRGLSLSSSPEAMQLAQNLLTNYESPVTVHNAPRVMKEALMFPYREGFAFELEVMRKTGKRNAFAGMFARPPEDTHEVLDPDAYLSHARSPHVTLPSLRAILEGSFEPYDSGSMGALDVRIMSTEFGKENDIYSVAEKWNGGAYVAVKRRSADKAAKATTADVALLYVSRWKTEEAATRFARIYANALPKRVNVLGQSTMNWNCTGNPRCQTPLWSTRVMTDEGPTFAEVWPGNIVIIGHSFDDETMSSLRGAVLAANLGSQQQASLHEHELTMSLFESQSFAGLLDQVREELAKDLMKSLEPRH
jgi:hypothetical protein